MGGFVPPRLHSPVIGSFHADSGGDREDSPLISLDRETTDRSDVVGRTIISLSVALRDGTRTEVAWSRAVHRAGFEMDLATFVGLLAAAGMVVWSLWAGTSGQVGVYWDTASIILVVGGTVFTVLNTQAIERFMSLFRVIKRGFFTNRMSLPETIRLFVTLGEIARREGVLALERALQDVDDEFLANGLRLVIDGTAAGEIEQILQSELEAMDQRHSQGKAMLDLFAKYAPAYGMIGTLMGLVAMLNNMDDPKKIGPGMAVAILTTFYGAIIANVLCLPLADKLNYRHEEEMLLRTVMLKGILSLQAGDNPRVTQAKLAVFLSGDRRKDVDRSAEESATK